MKKSTDHTRNLIDFIYRLNFKEIPEEVINKAKQCLMDSLGVIIGALLWPEGRKINKFDTDNSGLEITTLLGTGLKVPTLQAVFKHASLSEVLEFQDGHASAGLHPGTSVIPSAVAIGELKGISGKELLVSIVSGYEILGRIGSLIYGKSWGKISPTGLVGSLGSATAAGKILGLSKRELLSALGIASYLTPLSVGENFFTGFSCKPFQGGQGAEVGVKAIKLVMEGFSSSPNFLFGSPPGYVGLYAVFYSKGDQLEAKFYSKEDKIEAKEDKIEAGASLTEKLGEKFAISEVYFKPYPCGRLIHAAIDCIIALRKKYKINKEEIKHIRILTNTKTAWSLGQNYTDINSTFHKRQLSVPYVVATTLIEGQFKLEQLKPNRCKDEEIISLESKITVERSTELDKISTIEQKSRTTVVELCTTNGQKLTYRVDHPKGDYRNSLSWEEIEEKYRQLTEKILGPDKVNKSINLIKNIESINNIAKLIELLKVK